MMMMAEKGQRCFGKRMKEKQMERAIAVGLTMKQRRFGKAIGLWTMETMSTWLVGHFEH